MAHKLTFERLKSLSPERTDHNLHANLAPSSLRSQLDGFFRTLPVPLKIMVAHLCGLSKLSLDAKLDPLTGINVCTIEKGYKYV